MKTKIAFLMNYSAPHPNINSYLDLIWGWEFIIYDYSQYLIRNGYEVFWLLYSKSNFKFKPSLDGIHLIRIKKRFDWFNPLELLSLLFELTHIIRKYKFKILYTRAFFLGFIASLSCKITKIPFIYHIEDLDASLILALKQNESIFKRIIRYPLAFLALLIQMLAAVLADHILVVSSAFKHFLTTKWHISDKKITVLYEGIEIEKSFHIIYESSNFNKKYTYILYVGGITSYDGIDILIRAFAKVAEKVGNIRLIIATFSSEKDCIYLKKLCKSLNISEKVCFFHSITGQKARSIIRHSDIAIIPRRQNLSTELTTTSVIFLYISEGIPIICPKLKAIIEIMKNNALFFEPENIDSLADAIMKLVSDSNLRMKLRSRILRLRGIFDRERMCNRLLKVINTLLSNT